MLEVVWSGDINGPFRGLLATPPEPLPGEKPPTIMSRMVVALQELHRPVTGRELAALIDHDPQRTQQIAWMAVKRGSPGIRLVPGTRPTQYVATEDAAHNL